ncbi:hypothetical protein TSAR_004777 [Trichomalopsis sarcophagae]|uniref:Uncharacterized protein n=1 Tax=Trichomalopsis sarcophagae TaxID=543379 RepID=A0A232EPH0_9HYME|nr:hypothetical protein TSAR_004777 [Trichomalopsis sarcophagae]
MSSPGSTLSWTGSSSNKKSSTNHLK